MLSETSKALWRLYVAWLNYRAATLRERYMKAEVKHLTKRALYDTAMLTARKEASHDRRGG